jgi:type VI secretion system secreted protein VgrG
MCAMRIPLIGDVKDHAVDALHRTKAEFESVIDRIPKPAHIPSPTFGKPNDTEGRALTPGEVALARSVFGDSIDYDKVRINDRSYLPFGLQPDNQAMTPNGHMYFDPAGTLYRDDFSKADIGKQALFIHEMTHVWQHQHGVHVEADALKGLVESRGDYAEQYKYQLEPNKKFSDYNIEQQGDIARDYFYLLHGRRRDGEPDISAYRDVLPFA